MPEKKKATRLRITLEELTAALASDDSSVRWLTVMDYSKQKPTIEALPLLRQMLHDPDFSIVRCAAHSLRKLGPAAAEAMDDLIAAATKEYPNVPPQGFPHCVEAMAAIDPLHPGLLQTIRDDCLKYCSWVSIGYSLRALKLINNAQAQELMCEIIEFWRPKFSKMELRVAEKLREESKALKLANGVQLDSSLA